MQVCGSRNLNNRDTLLFAIDFNPSLFKTLQAVIQSGLSLWVVHYDCERQSRKAQSGTLACGQNPQQNRHLNTASEVKEVSRRSHRLSRRCLESRLTMSHKGLEIIVAHCPTLFPFSGRPIHCGTGG